MANPNNYKTPQSVLPEIFKVTNDLPNIKRAIGDAQILSRTDTAGAISKFRNNDTKLLNYLNQLSGISTALADMKAKGLDTSTAQQQYDNLVREINNLTVTNATLLDQARKNNPPQTPGLNPSPGSADRTTTGGSTTVIQPNPATGTTTTETVTPVNEQSSPGFTGSQGITAQLEQSRQDFVNQSAFNDSLNGDWRVRLTLAPATPNILYNVPPDQAGILLPLQATNGVVFPYMPAINIVYKANYDEVNLAHTNYKILAYNNSVVEAISITADFTAQDTHQADYVLAVIHFFRSVTKMFYGQDNNPKPGTPPPICYMYGLGQFQFNAHPLVITQFSYSLPNNVNYIRSSNTTSAPGQSKYESHIPDNSSEQDRLDRMWQGIIDARGGNGRMMPGGKLAKPQWEMDPSNSYPPTYVPTAMQIQLQALPVISRNKMSNQYSTKDYSSGQLLLGQQNAPYGGFW